MEVRQANQNNLYTKSTVILSNRIFIKQVGFRNPGKAILVLLLKENLSFGVGADKKRYEICGIIFQMKMIVLFFWYDYVQALNDCLSVVIKDRHCIWAQIPQFPMLKQRQSHSTVVLRDKYIFLYGGSNEDEIYDDFWIFNTQLQIWFELKQIQNKMKKRLNCTLSVIQDRIYMFGGQTEDQTYQNQLYILHFPIAEFQATFTNKDKIPELRCQKIVTNLGTLPCGRSCHSAVVYENRYLIVIGGEGIQANREGKGKGERDRDREKDKGVTSLLNDVWVFDTERLMWEFVDVGNRAVFKPRSCFTANLYRNKLYIFGGLISMQNFKSSDQLLVLSLTQSSQKPLQMCNFCKLHFRQPQPLQHPSTIQLPEPQSMVPTYTYTYQKSLHSYQFSISNIYKISRMLSNPFEAFQLIVEAYYRLKYKKITIDVLEGKMIIVQGFGRLMEEENFIQVMGKYEFVREVGVGEAQDQPSGKNARIREAIEHRLRQQDLQIFGYNIKNACSRLGHTFFFASRRGPLLDLSLTQNQTLFYCQTNLQQMTITPTQQKSYQIIKVYMQKNNINISLIEDQTFIIVISQLQMISVKEAELKVNGKGLVEDWGRQRRDKDRERAYSRPKNKKDKKDRKEGKKNSLQGFLAGMFLRAPDLELIVNLKNVHFMDLKQQYKRNRYQPPIQHDLKSIQLSVSQTPESQILIFRNNIRVGRYTYTPSPKQNPISSLLPPPTAIYLQGYIQLNILRNKIENSKIVEMQMDNICATFLGHPTQWEQGEGQGEHQGQGEHWGQDLGEPANGGDGGEAEDGGWEDGKRANWVGAQQLEEIVEMDAQGKGQNN